MTIVNIHEAKTRLSQLLAQVEAGEEVIIARAGKHIARLSLVHQAENSRQFGRDAGRYTVPDDFDEPLPADLLRQFSE